MTPLRRLLSLWSLGAALCSVVGAATTLPAIPLTPAPSPAASSATPQTPAQQSSPLSATAQPLPTVALPPIPQQPQASSAVAPLPASSGAGSGASSTEDKGNKKEIYLNFENTDLANFIEYIAELKKLSIIPDKSVEGAKISLTIREPLSVDGAWNIFLTVLEMSGFSIVQAGQVYKIVPKDKKLQQPLPSYVNTPYEKLPNNDSTIRYVFFLTNIQSGDLAQTGLLDSLLSQPSSIYELKEMNGFLFTDKSLNVRSAVKLLQELDQMGLPENVTVMRLKRINASDAKALLDQLIQRPDGNPLARLLGKVTEGSTEYFSKTTRVIPEERSNSLILLGNSKSIDKIVDFIANNIDTELKTAKSPLHIYELQYIDANQIASILRDVTAMPDSATGQVAGKYGSIRGGVKYFKNMTFQVDKDGNRLIANCPDPQDWQLVKKTIEDLDKPQPQVALESLIVTVNVDNSNFLGGVLRNKNHGDIGKNVDFQSSSLTGRPTLESNGDNSSAVSLLGNMLGQLTAAPGATLLTFGSKSNIWGALRAVKTQDNTSIIAQPFVTVANKAAATIEVGEIRRIVSDQQGSGDAAVQGFKDAPVSTSVKITPQINLDGIIRMDVDVTISEFTDNTGNNRSDKHLATNVTVADGQVLVLGGFVKTKIDENKAKTPLLADIPVLGWFFKNQSRAITKQYIFIFIAPTIVKPRQTPGMQLYTKMKLHQATNNIEEAIETKRVLDPVHNWFFNAEKENYSHKVIDFANARYQPTTVDIKNDTYYRSVVEKPLNKPSFFPPADLALVQAKSEEAQRQSMPQTAPATQEPEPEIPLMQDAASVLTPTLPPAGQSAPLSKPDDSMEMNDTVPLLPSDDPEIARQRKELRRLLAAPTPEAKQQEPAKAQEPVIMLPTQEPSYELVIDPAKRNNLKDFLSANPSLAQRTDRALDRLRRV